MEPSNNHMDIFYSKRKAIDHALWLNFKYRVGSIRFGVIDGPDRNWAVCDEATAHDMGVSFVDIPQDYVAMDYDDLRHLHMEQERLPHWETILGMFSVCDGEILRYLLHANIPLEKLIRFELASRGFDMNHRWCGFEKAKEIWLK